MKKSETDRSSGGDRPASKETTSRSGAVIGRIDPDTGDIDRVNLSELSGHILKFEHLGGGRYAFKVLDDNPRKVDRHSDMDLPSKKFSPKGRTLRKSFERPRPDLPSDAPENRAKKQVAVTLPPDLLNDLNAKSAELGVDRNTLIEFAIRQTLKNE